MRMRTADLSDKTGVCNVERPVTNKIRCRLENQTVEENTRKVVHIVFRRPPPWKDRTRRVSGSDSEADYTFILHDLTQHQSFLHVASGIKVGCIYLYPVNTSLDPILPFQPRIIWLSVLFLWKSIMTSATRFRVLASILAWWGSPRSHFGKGKSAGRSISTSAYWIKCSKALSRRLESSLWN